MTDEKASEVNKLPRAVAEVVLTAIIAVVFIFSVWLAASGPPRPVIMIKMPTTQEEGE